jgi:thiol-disulfide isomerase/thioredoxin
MITNVNSGDFILQSLDLSSPRIKAPKGCKGWVLLIKAEWCGHCRRYLPQFEEFSTKYPEYMFLVLEETNNTRCIQQWKELISPLFTVDGFPTVVVYDQLGIGATVVPNRFKLGDYLQ